MRTDNKKARARREFWSGVTDVFDLFGIGAQESNVVLTDQEAMRRDLDAIGGDFWSVLKSSQSRVTK
jgi:hypothetical protein